MLFGEAIEPEFLEWIPDWGQEKPVRFDPGCVRSDGTDAEKAQDVGLVSDRGVRRGFGSNYPGCGNLGAKSGKTGIRAFLAV